MKKLIIFLSASFLALTAEGVLQRDPIATVAQSQDYNIAAHDFGDKSTKLLHYEDSIWSSEHEAISAFVDSNNSTNNDGSTVNYGPVTSDTTTTPYKYVCMLETPQGCGTAFFIGKNVLLTAGHCVYNTSGFVQSVRIWPGKNGGSTPYGYFNVKKAYIQKEYYLTPDHNYDFDWAVVMIDASESTGTHPGGNFGKIGNYSREDERLFVYGYPDSFMNETQGNIRYYTEKRLEYSCQTAGGFSGGPVLIRRNNNWFAIGIHTAHNNDNTSWGGTRINSLIYFLTNSLLLENTVEVKNFYLNGSHHSERYNCVGKIVANPASGSEIQISKNGSVFSNGFTTFEESFYTSNNETAFVQYPFDYYRCYDRATGQYSSTRRLSTTFSQEELSAKFPMVSRTANNVTLPTSFDQPANKWAHGGAIGKAIKGTVVYNKTARNIEVSIPLLGTKKSSEVTIDNVTFQLRCGPNYVSIKSSRAIDCNDTTKFFAFGVA